MSEDIAARCVEPDPLQPGRCPLMADQTGRCEGHQVQSRIVVDDAWPEAPILREMRFIATEAQALMLLGSAADPDRARDFETRKRQLVDALREW
jgi:hypothetical protein